jgi:hypothetical protein
MSEMGFVYDLHLPPKTSPDYIKPKPNDDEVESFTVRLSFIPTYHVLTSLS